MSFDITSTPAQPYKSVCSIDHYNMHISLCICDFENELSIINQVFCINNHWKYGLYFDIATSSISNEHLPILDCIVIYQQFILKYELLMNSLWKHLFHQNIIFNYIFFHCLFSWRVVPCCDWLQCKYWLDTKWSTDIYCCFFVNCIFCVASECAEI